MLQQFADSVRNFIVVQNDRSCLPVCRADGVCETKNVFEVKMSKDVQQC